jgi:capsid assembly protease
VRNAQNGLSVTALYAGAHKNDATPHAPLTPQATDALQSEIDRLYALFVDHVAQMRGLDAGAVRATEAALFFGEDALAAGLADGLASFDATLADFVTALGRHAPGSNRRSPASHTPLALPTRLALPTLTEPSMTQPTEAAPAPSTPPAAPAATALATVPAVAPAALPAPAATAAPPSTDPQAEAVAIAELCLLAGCPERTTEFLAGGMRVAQVRQVLLQARADQVEIASHHLADAAPAAAATTANPVLDAVRKRIASTTPQGA